MPRPLGWDAGGGLRAIVVFLSFVVHDRAVVDSGKLPGAGWLGPGNDLEFARLAHRCQFGISMAAFVVQNLRASSRLDRLRFLCALLFNHTVGRLVLQEHAEDAEGV